ncbi:VWA domain-containing protein [Bradyrhizobium sp. 83002]|uniref:VWA domain-containing protein n=1 Tax=Bradyrhizobium aeschynomenes TaxID=2734909 RepID=UPI0015516C10|nr:VWA domain-containing protein [Bradyrhizobium aeschynomenes]NPU11978.1 VWA domain-containing protein [Bradyrhizobium aeschynomenes]
MPYSAEISRDNPTCILFVIDQSGSMDEKMTTGKSKAEFVADVLNKTIYTLITNCTKSDGVRNYFDVGVIGYGGAGVGKGLGGALAGRLVHPITALESSPLRIEDRTRLEDDGAGGVLERKVKFPIWFDATASGGTPMCAALTQAAEQLVAWCDSHPGNYPPTVLHVTDGASTDGDPESIASAIRQLSTNDGECLLFNIHVSTLQGETIRFPNSGSTLADNYANLLFRMSSVLPSHVAKLATDKGYSMAEHARGFMFNADPKDIANFFDIGTRPRLTADR